MHKPTSTISLIEGVGSIRLSISRISRVQGCTFDVNESIRNQIAINTKKTSFQVTNI